MAIQRIALSQPIESRKASFEKDSYTANVVFESHDQTRDFVKRPGLIKKATVVETTPPAGVFTQGLFEYSDNLISVIEDEVYKIDPLLGTVTDLGPFPTDILTNHRVYGTKTFNGAELFMHNGETGALIDGAYNVTEITNDHVVSIDVINGGVNYSVGSTIAITAAPPTGTDATATLSFAGVAGGSITAATVTSVGSGYLSTPSAGIVKPDDVFGTVTGVAGQSSILINSYDITAGTIVYAGMAFNYGGQTYYVSQTKDLPSAIGPLEVLLTAPLATSFTFYTPSASYPLFYDAGESAVFSVNLNSFPTVEKVPGAVYLDQYVFVGCTDNKIYNSNLSDASSWEPLSYISFIQSNDTLVGISRYLNYLVAFGKKSMNFFYDAAVSPGSPLQLAASYSSEVGCASGDSIAQTDQSIFWVGTSKTHGRCVFLLDGTSPTRVSTTFIERYLEKSTMAEVTAYSYKFDGHLLYILTLHDLDVTLVYDAVEKVWHKWSSYGLVRSGEPGVGTYRESFFDPCFYAKADEKAFVLSYNTGDLFYFDQETYTDDGRAIYCRAVTDIVDNGTTNRKFYNRLEIVGNKVGGTIKVRHTSDDYQTWSQYRSIDLSKIRSQIYQSGQSRRRAWEFLCTDNIPLRLDAAEIDFEVGGLDPQQDVGGGTRYRR